MLTARDRFLDRIRGEYVEMPDLKLTNWQACRLWNLDTRQCEAALRALVAEGFLSETKDGAFLRRGRDHHTFRATVPDWLPGGLDDEHARPRIDDPLEENPPLVDKPQEQPPTDVEGDLTLLGI